MPSDVYNSSDTWTCPADVYFVKVEVIAAGGGSSAGGAGATSARASAGGGAYSRLNAYPVVPGNNYTVTVGTGGPIGTVGGDSWFDTSSTVLAKGGGPGLANTTPGTGGQASAGIGDVKFSGGNSGSVSGGQASPGAGGSATSTSNGGNGTDSVGGTPGTGGTGTGAGANGATFGNAGNAGNAPGGGASGGGSNLGAGNTGANGRVTITYPIDSAVSRKMVGAAGSLIF